MNLIFLSLDELKESLFNEINQWRTVFANTLLELSKLKTLYSYISDRYNQLALPINYLVDAKRVVFCLEDVENSLTELDNDVEITIKLYDILNEYKAQIPPDSERHLNLLIDGFKKLQIKVMFIK
jgi:hypothetical protein